MNKAIFTILLLLAVFFTFNLSAALSPGHPPENEPANTDPATPPGQKVDSLVLKKLEKSEETRVLIVLKNDSFEDLREKKVRVKDKQENVLKTLTKNDFRPEIRYNTIYFLAGNVTSGGIKKLEKDPYVEVILDASGMGEGALAESVPLVNGPATWDLGYDGTGQTVCVVDSGVDYTNSELGGCFGTGCKVIAGHDYVNSDGDPMDDNGHGTWVTGILISSKETLKGLAPGVKITAVKVLGDDGRGPWTDIAAGVDWCVNNKDTYNISVISMSIGSSDRVYNSPACLDTSGSIAVASAIDTAVANGLFVSTASGNYGNTTGISFPACRGNAVSVGATYDADVGIFTGTTCTDATTAADKIACFTGRNSLLDLLAPGALINAQWLSGGYYNGVGTSASAPHVSGAAAILRQINSNLGPLEIRDILKGTGVGVYDSATGLTFPRLDVLNASTYVLPPSQSNWTPANGSNVSSTSPTITFDTNENAWCRWSLSDLGYGDISGSNDCSGGGTASSSCPVSGLSQGPGTVYIACRDTQNHEDTADANTHLYYVNLQSVIIHSPQNTTYKSDSVDLNYTVYYPSWSDWAGYSLDGNDNITLTGNTTLTNLSDGQHNVIVYANDTEGNMSSSAVWFTVDATPPTVAIASPQNTTYNTNSVDLDYFVTDEGGIDRVGYSLDGQGNVTTSGEVTTFSNPPGADLGTAANITFNQTGSNTSVYIKVPENATVYSATMDVSGHYNSQLPTESSIYGSPPIIPTELDLNLLNKDGTNIDVNLLLTICYLDSDLNTHCINSVDDPDIITWSIYLGKSSVYSRVSAKGGTDITINVEGYESLTVTAVEGGYVTGDYYLSIVYPSNLSIDTSNDAYADWSMTGGLNYTNSPQTVDLNITAINDFLSTCTKDVQGYCSITLNISSDSAGILQLDALSVKYYSNGTLTLSNGAHNVVVHANDSAGNLASSSVYFTVDTTPQNITVYNISLNAEWNLISIPLEQDNWNITSVLAPIDGNYSAVFAYINGTWEKSTAARDPLMEMSLEYGYWIYMNVSDTLELSGTVPNSTTINIIGPEWNLAGYPSFTTRNITDVLSGINYTVVFAYIDDVWEMSTAARDPLTEMTTGYGYWIYANEAGSYEV